MNSLRKRVEGQFRQGINEPAGQAKTGKALETRGLAKRCGPSARGMIMDGPSLNHS